MMVLKEPYLIYDNVLAVDQWFSNLTRIAHTKPFLSKNIYKEAAH